MPQMPQELEVWYVLPAIRKGLVLAMKTEGLKQKEIAEALCITEPAVSQYMKSKRAADIEFSDDIKKMIQVSAKKIIKDKSCMMAEVQKAARQIKKSGELCRLHHRHADLPKGCCICMKK